MLADKRFVDGGCTFEIQQLHPILFDKGLDELTEDSVVGEKSFVAAIVDVHAGVLRLHIAKRTADVARNDSRESIILRRRHPPYGIYLDQRYSGPKLAQARKSAPTGSFAPNMAHTLGRKIVSSGTLCM